MLHDDQGLPQLVPPRSLAMIIEAAARDVRIVVLNACFSAAQAEALLTKVDCVVGTDGMIDDDEVRAFTMAPGLARCTSPLQTPFARAIATTTNPDRTQRTRPCPRGIQ